MMWGPFCGVVTESGNNLKDGVGVGIKCNKYDLKTLRLTLTLRLSVLKKFRPIFEISINI